MKNRLIAGGVIGLILLALTIINEIGIDNKEQTEVDTTSVITTQIETTTTETTTTTTTSVPTTHKTTKKVITSKGSGYKITHYGHDCRGCSGITASGYNVKNTIYYNDSEYGQVRVVATNKSFSLYSIIKIKNYKTGGDIVAIVLDRGVGSGVIDLLVSSEKEASKLGIQRNVEVEVLRKGR